MANQEPQHENGSPRESNRLGKRIIGTFVEFDKLESSGSIVLVSCAVLAIVLANSPLGATFLGFWERHLRLGIDLSLRHWINDGLMALFFFLVGLEIKREMAVGELATWRRAVLPILAAVGGMAVPAALYVAFNLGGPGQRGWGIAMATDIAFSLGVLALLGSRVPTGIKVFLTALAIADDLGAVLVIALFYTSNLNVAMLLGAAGVLVAAYVLSRRGIDSPWLFVVLGPVAWFLTHESGVHATLAGVAMAFMVPARRRIYGEQNRVLELSLIENMLHRLHPWITYAVVPLFALANSGVRFGGAEIGGPIALGVFFGLALGKPVGIVALSYVAVKLNLASLPRGVRWMHVLGAGILAGIGFTMSLFIAELAFGVGENLDTSKAGIFAASALSALVGYLVMRSACSRDGNGGAANPAPADDPHPGPSEA